MLRKIVSGVAAGAAVCGLLGLVDGCLTRPVEASNPITKTNFITSIPQGSIDKVDLLFDIDNSASMGDKQAYLAQAIPDLITRLVQPNCVDNAGNPTGQQSDTSGNCPMGGNAEFPPVHNMHIGILSSSLGARLGDACTTTGMLAMQTLPGSQGSIDRHNDDQAHLLDRAALMPNNLSNYQETTEPAADDMSAGGGHFLDWFPTSNPLNMGVTPTGPAPITDPMALGNTFGAMVIGVHQFGCGIESQLETWYRFLIQPDPYASLAIQNQGNCNKAPCRAQWVGVDTTILAQRADFLRKDSLVAILVLTDENDSEVDVRSFGGSGYNFMTSTWPPPRATAICATNPGDPNCKSCAFSGTSGDPGCKTNGGVWNSPTDWGFDLNLRHVHEKQKYGVSVQFPIQRYVVGLTSLKVPDRNGEYPPDGKNDGGYAGAYSGLDPMNQKCVNPLFAMNLPTPNDSSLATNFTSDTENKLCNLTPGPRTPNLVYYAHIGGVPHQLLQVDPTNQDSPQKDVLTDADWQLILGKDPENFVYDGIDPHMRESYQPRTQYNMNLPQGAHPVSPETSPGGTDPISGREWITDSTMPEHNGLRVDREYACIFKLAQPRDCSDTATAADPTLLDSCDCMSPVMGTGTAFTQAQNPAVCNDTTQTQQDYAKAYPTIRELEVAWLLGKVQGANEGIISSLCPIHTTEQTPGDPLFGYRPAMNAIVNRLKQSLSHQCLPQRLQIKSTPLDDGGSADTVPCLVLGTFPNQPASTDCSTIPGYSNPDPQILQHFREDQHAQWTQNGAAGTDPSTELTCKLQQLTPNMKCDTGTDVGWCYIDNGSVMGCAQAILFNKQALQGGVTTSLQCIEASGDASF